MDRPGAGAWKRAWDLLGPANSTSCHELVIPRVMRRDPSMSKAPPPTPPPPPTSPQTPPPPGSLCMGPAGTCKLPLLPVCLVWSSLVWSVCSPPTSSLLAPPRPTPTTPPTPCPHRVARRRPLAPSPPRPLASSPPRLLASRLLASSPPRPTPTTPSHATPHRVAQRRRRQLADAQVAHEHLVRHHHGLVGGGRGGRGGQGRARGVWAFGGGGGEGMAGGWEGLGEGYRSD